MYRNKLTKSGPSRPTVSNTIDLIVAGDTNSQTTSIITTNTTVTPPAQPTVIARVIHHLGQVSSSCNTQTSTTVTATKQLSGTCTTDTTAEVEKDPHNEGQFHQILLLCQKTGSLSVLQLSGAENNGLLGISRH